MTDKTEAEREALAADQAHGDKELKQFPAKAGDVQAEIDKRTVDGAADGKFVKVIRGQYDSDDLTEDQHNRNKDTVLREAINRGLHPKAEVEHAGTELFRETRRGKKTYDVRYEVEVEPSSIDSHPETTITPANNPDKPQAKEAKVGEVSRDNVKKTDPPAAKKD